MAAFPESLQSEVDEDCQQCVLVYLDKVHENVSQTLHVVSPALLDAEVSVDAGVPRSPGQVLVFSVGDVLVCPRVSVLLGETKVNDVHEVSFLSQPPKTRVYS